MGIFQLCAVTGCVYGLNIPPEPTVRNRKNILSHQSITKTFFFSLGSWDTCQDTRWSFHFFSNFSQSPFFEQYHFTGSTSSQNSHSPFISASRGLTKDKGIENGILARRKETWGTYSTSLVWLICIWIQLTLLLQNCIETSIDSHSLLLLLTKPLLSLTQTKSSLYLQALVSLPNCNFLCFCSSFMSYYQTWTVSEKPVSISVEQTLQEIKFCIGRTVFHKCYLMAAGLACHRIALLEIPYHNWESPSRDWSNPFRHVGLDCYSMYWLVLLRNPAWKSHSQFIKLHWMYHIQCGTPCCLEYWRKGIEKLNDYSVGFWDTCSSV